jgi:hypothetical protein
MTKQWRNFVLIVPLIICGTSTLANAQSAPSTSYSPPKTPWGDPDLQGLWPGKAALPLQRDPKYGNQIYLTPQQVQERQAEVEKRKQEDARIDNGSKLRRDNPRYWVEYRDASNQSALLIDPPNGRLPALTAEAKERRKQQKLLANAGTGTHYPGTVEGEFNSYLDFDFYNRCITRGLFDSMGSTIYNNGNQILQEPGYVVIRNEMIHEARVVPLDEPAHVGEKIRLYLGDSRGHWEGNTLVIETTNMTDAPIALSGAGNPSKAVRMIERFTRTAPDQLNYELTVIDPQTWTAPWTIRIPYTSDPQYQIYEYACHESNYGVENILSGARQIEKEGVDLTKLPSYKRALN